MSFLIKPKIKPIKKVKKEICKRYTNQQSVKSSEKENCSRTHYENCPCQRVHHTSNRFTSLVQLHPIWNHKKLDVDTTTPIYYLYVSSVFNVYIICLGIPWDNTHKSLLPQNPHPSFFSHLEYTCMIPFTPSICVFKTHSQKNQQKTLSQHTCYNNYN